MRPCLFFIFVFLLLCGANGAQIYLASQIKSRNLIEQSQLKQLVKETGFCDLALSTEARYTRHISLSDRVVPFMDHPGSLEHFPSGSIIRPPETYRKGI